jgi:cellulose synthase/poly-beta-1,6-N-acetylglucosamine synthase-like glycosyltransferase
MLWVGLASFCAVASVFVTYYLLVLKSPKVSEYTRAIEKAMSNDLLANELPRVSVLVPAYNEEEVIVRRLEDIAAMEYPREKIEVVLIDDCSTDGTSVVAKRRLDELGLSGRILRNQERMGLNGCINRGVEESKGDLVLTTDADVTVDHDALIKSLRVLLSVGHAGAITARMIPVSETQTNAVRIEKSYRDLYDSMAVAESAIHSTFPGYSPFALFRKSTFTAIPVGYGSCDGNISLSIIRRGLRFLLVPNIAFYEPVASDIREQIRQKTRRAARQVQSVLANKEMLFRHEYGAFGMRILPLRFLMMTLCPPLFLVGFAGLFLAAVWESAGWPLLVLCLALLVSYVAGKAKPGRLGLPVSVFAHLLYLSIGLVMSTQNLRIWKPIERSTTGKAL